MRTATITPAGRLLRIAGGYPARVPRASVDGVRALLGRVGPALPERVVVVVGTNGKSSTAVQLGRVLEAEGVACGVTVSPHLRRFGERVLVRGGEVSDAELADAVEALHEEAVVLGPAADLRFFDLLTLAAVRLFAAAGVEVGVFEAGIGGRTDAVAALAAPLVLLTGVGLDHTGLLGRTKAAILREKLGAAPPGARVLAAPLPAGLRTEAGRVAAARGLELSLVEAPGAWPERNAALAAAAAAELLGRVPAPRPFAGVPGRLQRVHVEGVEVLLDAAHNEQAWAELEPFLPERFVAVLAAPAGRPAGGLARLAGRAAWVLETRVRDGSAAPRQAVRAGLERARQLELPLVVTGSTYLLGPALEALGL